MEISKKTQDSGNGCLNVQAETVTINTGISIAQIREIALEVFQNNFYNLAGIAKDTALLRAQEITEQFLREFATRNPNGIEASKEPDFQYSLYTIQKAYARSGDKVLANLLVDMLVEKTISDQKDVLQVTINEALEVVSKITYDQLAILKFYFDLEGIGCSNRFTTVKEIADHICRHILPIVRKPVLSAANFNHLIFIGCLNQTNVINFFESVVANYFPGVFSKGFSLEDITQLLKNKINVHELIIPYLKDCNLWQFKYLTFNDLYFKLQQMGATEIEFTELKKFWFKHLMNKDEIRNEFYRERGEVLELVSLWQNIKYARYNLTNIGVVIANAYSRTCGGNEIDPSTWIF